jgi:hypothetical protein
MPNQVEPGTMGGAPPESTDSGGTAMSVQAAYGGAGGPDVLGGPGPGGLAQAAGPTGEHATFHGRAVSWVAVVLIMVGFLVGGLSLVFAAWPTFWVGAGLVVIGGLIALTTDIFEDWY